MRKTTTICDCCGKDVTTFILESPYVVPGVTILCVLNMRDNNNRQMPDICLDCARKTLFGWLDKSRPKAPTLPRTLPDDVVAVVGRDVVARYNPFKMYDDLVRTTWTAAYDALVNKPVAIEPGAVNVFHDKAVAEVLAASIDKPAPYAAPRFVHLVPEGYALVPIEPTPAMLAAGYDVWKASVVTTHASLPAIYGAMINAAAQR